MSLVRTFRYMLDTTRIVVLGSIRRVWRFVRLCPPVVCTSLAAQTSIEAQPDSSTVQDFAFANKNTAFFDTASKHTRVLVLDSYYPMPDRDSGSLRMFNMLSLLCESGCAVQFMIAQRYERNSYTDALERLGVELIAADAPLRRLRWWYRNGASLDVVVLSRLPVAMRHMRHARRYAEQAKLIFDTVDLHFLRLARGAALQHDNAAAARAERMQHEELALMRKADLTLVVSDYEQDVLHRLVPSVPVAVLSNVHEVYGRAADFGDRAGLLFLGNFEHEPNIDAARMLIDEVMPLLAQSLPGVMLSIVGHAAQEALGRSHANNVQILGYVADLSDILARVRIAVAPLRYGAGVKGKINMAMSHGVPVVATSIGVEGMRLIPGDDVLVADDASTFAATVTTLYGDEALWRKLSDKGLENVRRHFSLEVGRQAITRMLSQ